MIEREKLQHLIENIGIPKLCLILLLGISLIIVSIPSGKTKKNTQSTETTAKEDSTDLYVKKQEKRLVNALKHVEGVGKVKVMITVNSSKEAVVNKDSPYEQSSSEKENFDAYMETLQELCRKDGISTKLTVCYNSLQGEKTYDINEKIVDYVLLSYTLKVYIICTVEY